MSPRARTGLVAAVIVLSAAAGLTGILLAVSTSDGTRPTSERQTENWDTRRLADELRQRGLGKLEVLRCKNETYFILESRFNDDQRDAVCGRAAVPVKTAGAVSVSNFRSPASAQAFWRQLDDNTQASNEVFVWNQFIFFGLADDIGKLRSILK